MPASSNWPPSAATSTSGTAPRPVPAHKSGNRPKGPQEPKAHSAPELLHSMDPQRERELAEKAAPAPQDHPGSTQAPQGGPMEPEARLAPPGGPDRGSIPIHPGTAQEPGPMPKEPGAVWPFGLSRLTAMAQARDRAGLEAFQAMRLPPKVGLYKAELLAWLDRVEAYEKSKPKHPNLK